MSQRLTTPMVRENGQLREASWDEALDRAAEGFRSVVDAHGPTAALRQGACRRGRSTETGRTPLMGDT